MDVEKAFEHMEWDYFKYVLVKLDMEPYYYCPVAHKQLGSS